MIGSAVGGYVDPEQISQFGPRLTDASQQTARDGIPIPYGWGTFVCAGNIIWCAPIIEHVNESTDRAGKGGPEVTSTTYTYTRSYALGICQGQIAGILVIKRNGKIVYEARPDATLLALGMTQDQINASRAASAAFLLKCTIYTGSETQIADATIEAYEGVGEVNANRGLAYIVITDDDVTELRGAIPQYEFVVAVDGTSSETTIPVLGVQTAEITLDSSNFKYSYSHAVGELLFTAHVLGEGDTYLYEYRDKDLNVVFSGSVAVPGVRARAMHASGWAVFSDGDTNGCHLLHGGELKAKLRPDETQPLGWWGVEELGATGEYGGLIHFANRSVYIGVRQGALETFNRIYRWPLSDADGDFLNADAVSPVLTAGAKFWTAIATDGRIFAVTLDEAELIEMNSTLDVVETRSIPFTLGTEFRGFGVDDNLLFVIRYSFVDIYFLDDLTLYTSIPITNNSLVNNRFSFTTDSVFVQTSGDTIQRLEYTPPCLTYIPYGWRLDPHGMGVISPRGTVWPVCGMTTTLDDDAVPLSTIVADLFERVGIPSTQYDVSQLTDEVLGYRVLPNGSGIDAAIAPLMLAYRFDVGEWDGKLRCIKRGGASSLSLTADDLAEREGGALEWTRVQEAELLRLQTVAYIDPAAGYTATTQKWERRAGTVQAKGEAAIEVPITATADTAAGIAKMRGLIAWSEPDKASLSLPYRRSKVTPTDVLTLTDAASRSHRLRVMQVEEDSGVLLIEAARERASTYGLTATGVTPGTPTIPGGGGLVGPTILHAMNLPRLRTADSTPGAYLAVTGVLPGWKGADIYISADGGVSEQFAARIMARATMGRLLTPVSSTGEPIVVDLYDNRTLSSITAEQLAARQNAFSITTDSVSEVGQFQTATETTSGGYWELTDNVRGSLATTAATHYPEDEFTLLDSAVYFLPLDISLAGKTLVLRAVSIGTALEDNETVSFVYIPQFVSEDTIAYMLDETGQQMLDETGAYLVE